ncbi:ketopantoate hydroxymethyltransferase [Shewanella psychrophila]|uniref:3-methyl-2-oxobutanoate hydroxymethyltransferase n=1 Tax=Shewanella psychrophila TaxID=225848 RepID=A0A1S6HXQ3_9GAMM|nr:3-methyl-2-oxobutanoate hydroxymethyltransferase [Shewanella psychrophila]AQS40335.1 ketopantoate hydroxymethyltransferase [Shewanella psychrophila]
MKKVTISDLNNWKLLGHKFASITAYDASFAKVFEQQNMPVLIVGDSLGSVIQGKETTLGVNVKDIAYHTECVRVGSPNSFIISDMPFMSYPTPEIACESAATLMKAGANMVKLEGSGWLAETVKVLTERAVPVCVHLGLLPQAVNIHGGYKVQGKTQEQAENMLNDALQLQNAGAQVLVLECVPATLADKITSKLDIPVIGIGAGKNTDGQVLVMHDILGISANYIPRFTKNFLAGSNDINSAVAKYIEAVQLQTFPEDEHCFQ